MVLAREGGVITRLSKPLREKDLVSRQSRMQLRRSGVVWISPSDDAASTWRTTACCQIGIFEDQTLGGHAVQMGRLDHLVPITSKVIRRDVVRDIENEIRLTSR